MNTELIIHSIANYKTYRGVQYKNLDISYQTFGLPLGNAPIVVINHALTGNSDVISPKKGWWKDIVGAGKLIDTNRYTVIAFNIPGNGYDNTLIDKYQDFVAKDIAALFLQVLQEIGVQKLHAIIGGSLGGGIAWEMAVLHPTFIDFLIPIAAHWQSSDWIIGHNHIQANLLENSSQPLADARKMAMLFYRTPASFSQKFNRTKTANNEQYNVESWLDHHGNKLNERFELKAYKMMNHLLANIDITTQEKSFKKVIKPIQSKVIQIAIDSDLFFVKEDNINSHELLLQLGIDSTYHEIKSIHGHDAFLIENEQIQSFLEPVFNKKK